jgi:hypothetical protein
MIMNLITTRRVLTASAVAVVLAASAATSLDAQIFAQPDRDPRVNLRFDRYYDYAAMTNALRELQRTYSKFLTLQSIGKSGEGRDIWLMTVNNPDTGPHTSKAAFWADANIHGNEIQGTEVNLYLLWFLMENYEALPKVRELVDARTFYIVPTMNPDGRENFLKTGGPSRSGMLTWDNDQDGQLDEDDTDDLDGDGEIRQMRKHVPGQGTHVTSPVDPRLMVVAPEGTKGDYILLGSEGLLLVIDIVDDQHLEVGPVLRW